MPETVTAPSFTDVIDSNRTTDGVPDDFAILRTDESYLHAQLDGAVILGLSLSPADTVPMADEPSPEEQETAAARRVDILYSEPARPASGIGGSYIMLPAGPNKNNDGNHGFARQANYREIYRHDIPGVEQRMTLQAETPRHPVAIKKVFSLGRSALTTHTTITSTGSELTSLGENLDFRLDDQQLDGLRINGRFWNDLPSRTSIVLDGFGGQAEIIFPAGHIIRLTSAFTGFTQLPLSLRIRHRQGSIRSLCLETVAGADAKRDDGIMLVPGIDATLTTRIELLRSNPEQVASQEPERTPLRTPAGLRRP